MTVDLIRKYLRSCPDGPRIPDIAKAIGVKDLSVYKRLQNMPDCYIDRWVPSPGTGGFGPVWCAVEVPENCPKPDRP